MRSRTLSSFVVAVILNVGVLTPSAFSYSTSQFESVTTSEDHQINQIRDQEINQLRIVMGRRFAESRKPDILLRLAELYIEKYRFYFFKENQIHQELIKTDKKRKLDHTRSRKYLVSATQVCLAILRSKVPYGKLDQVYYFLGYNAEEMDKRGQAFTYFTKVVNQFPRSAYAPEAYRNMAEYSFDQKKYNDALRYYERAATYTNVPSYPRTLYKLSWAYFKVRRRSEALSTMKRMIEVTSKDEKFVSLREEGLNDLALFYSEAGRFSEAASFFKQATGGPEYYLKALLRLSSIYENQGKYAMAIALNNGMIDEYGSNRADLTYPALLRNVELAKKQGRDEDKATAELVSYFIRNGDDIKKTEEGKAAFDRVKGYSRARAADIHKDAQKKKNKKLYSQAADLYGIYLKSFLQDPSNEKEEKEQSEVRYFRSDCLLASDREKEAMDELAKVLETKGDAKHRREAGATLLNLLISKIDQKIKSKQPVPSDLEASFVRTVNTFEDVFPKDPLAAELGYKKAMLEAGKSSKDGLSKNARSSLMELIEKYPNRKEAAEGARLLVQDRLDRKQNEDASELAGDFLKNTSLLNSGRSEGLETFLRSVLTRASFENVREIEKDRNFSKAASEYERLAESSKHEEEVYLKSLNNAAFNYLKAGDSENSTRIYLKLAGSAKPGSKVLESAKSELKRVALMNMWSGRFVEAAQVYATLYSKNYFSSEERLGFATTASTLFWGAGKVSEAYKMMTHTLSSSCRKTFSHEECHTLTMNVGEILDESGKNEDAVAFYKSYLNMSLSNARKSEAAFRLAAIYKKLHETKKAVGHYEEAVRVYKPSQKNLKERNFAAHAQFILIEPMYAEYSRINLDLPEEKLKADTKQKLTLLESMVSRYQKVVSLGDGEWGIAALERISSSFLSFAEEIESVPVPPRLTDEKAKEQYRSGIRSFAEPLRQRAKENLTAGLKTGVNLDVTSPTFVSLHQRLAEAAPKSYPPAHFSLYLSGADGDLGGGGKSAENSSTLLLMGNFGKSSEREELAAKLEKSPRNSELWLELANLEIAARRFKIARLFLEQALSYNRKNVAALNNLGVLFLLENNSLEAGNFFNKAMDHAEFNKTVRLNLIHLLLYYHHFKKAEELARPLVGRYPGDEDILESYAVALLGSGNAFDAFTRFQSLKFSSSDRFSRWYNGSIAAVLAGDKKSQEKAFDILQDKVRSVSGSEKRALDQALRSFKRGQQ